MGSVIGGVVGTLTGGIAQGAGALNNYQAQTPDIIRQNSLPQEYTNRLVDLNRTQSNQQNLANALLAQSQGQGPSLAQNQLQNALQQNVQQQAGLIGSQKGINPALAARMIQQQGANLGQQAALQSAGLAAQEQMNARGQLGNVYGAMGGQSLNAAQIAQQAIAAQNNAINQGTLGAQQINASGAAQNAKTNAGIAGGILGGVGSALGLAEGGEVPGNSKNKSSWAESFRGMQDDSDSALGMGLGKLIGGGAKAAGKGIYNSLTNPVGGMVGQTGSADLMYKPAFQNPMALTSNVPMLPASDGGYVPGQAEVEGDDERNDKVPAMLSPGEIVVPRTKAKSADKAKEFIDELKGKSKKKETNYGDVLKAHRELSKRVEDLENHIRGA